LNILVTNDDGINSPGLWALVAELRKIGKVMVAAPDREQSGVGTSVTLHSPVRAWRIKGPMKGVTTYAVEGTPADSVILALGRLLRNKVDLVVSGINSGSNLGQDVLISGTVGAAFQGYVRGLPAMALSVGALKKVQFEPAARLGARLALALTEGGFSSTCFLNVNLPNLPAGELHDIEVTRLAGRSYRDRIKTGFDGKRRYYWIVRDKPDPTVEEGTDVWAVNNKRVSVTPIHSDFTCADHAAVLKKLCPQLTEALKP